MAKYAYEIAATIPPDDATKWAEGTPIDWANESTIISRDVVYKGVPADGDPPKLDRLYVENGVVVVRDRLAKAGVRLAMVLNPVAK